MSVSQEDVEAARSAICLIVAQTIKEIAARAGVSDEAVKRAIKLEEEHIEKRGRRYRYDNAIEWIELDPARPLPKRGSVRYLRSGGYEVEET